MTSITFSRVKPGSTLKKLSNGDKVGVKLIKERVVVAAETLFMTELGDYNGVTLRMTLEEARHFQKELAETIAALEALPTELATASEN